MPPATGLLCQHATRMHPTSSCQYLNLTKPPEKYLRIKSEGGSKKEKTKKKKKAPRNVNVHDFYLFLSSHVVYGDCTLMLSFCLEHYARTNVAEVLMVMSSEGRANGCV